MDFTRICRMLQLGGVLTPVCGVCEFGFNYFAFIVFVVPGLIAFAMGVGGLLVARWYRRRKLSDS